MRKQNESEDGGMRELRERFEVVEVGKHSRGKEREFVVVEIVRKQSESGDGGMRELRERFEVVEVGKRSRGKGCQFIVIER